MKTATTYSVPRWQPKSALRIRQRAGEGPLSVYVIVHATPGMCSSGLTVFTPITSR